MKKNQAILQKNSPYYNKFEKKTKFFYKKLKTHALIVSINLVIGLATFGIISAFDGFSRFLKKQNNTNLELAYNLYKNRSKTPKFYILKDGSNFNNDKIYNNKNFEFYMIDDNRIDMLKF